VKVLNIILDPRLGGPQWRIAEVAKRLKEEGIETIVVFPDKDSEKFKKLLNDYGIEYRAIKLNKLSKSIVGFLKWKITFIPQILRLKRLIKKENPDVVHCNASWQWKGVIASKLAKKKVVWHLNDTKMPFYIKIVFKYLVKKVDGIIVAGSRVKGYYLKNFIIEKPILEIQAPVDTEKFNPDIVKPNKNLLKYKGIRILSVGNVNPYKGFECFIDAANILNKKYKDLWFFVAGNLFDTQKKYIDYLKKKIEDFDLKNFMFLGGVDNIKEVLKSSDIYVCSSVAEASPQSVWEAMAMKKPIVSTDVGSVPDFIKDNKNGFIVEIKKSEQIANKVGVLIENKELRESFGKLSREVAINQLDINICSEKHGEIYKEVIAK